MNTAIQTQVKPKRSLLFVLAVFILPVVLAKLALDQSWFEQAATNRGELLQPVVNLTSSLAEQSPKWRIMYVLPETCDARCENAVYAIQQVWLALGKESDRAQPAVFVKEPSASTVQALLHDFEHINAIAVSGDEFSELTGSELGGYVFLVDTQNNAMLRYPAFALRQDAVMGSRDILADLRKLLKLSRIG